MEANSVRAFAVLFGGAVVAAFVLYLLNATASPIVAQVVGFVPTPAPAASNGQ